MIALGIDAVDIDRFNSWKDFSQKKLSRILSAEEIRYCLSVPTKTSERIAVRFAAKEALYKALAPLNKKSLSLFRLCTHSSVHHGQQGNPILHVHWSALDLQPMNTSLSLSHTKTTAFAVVLIEY